MRYITISILLILFHSSLLFAQPYWVINKSLENHEGYYFGIGVSEISEMDADEDAYLHFGKMIEVKVQSTTERVLEENNTDINDVFVNSTKIESDVKLKGIAVSERFIDNDNNLYYSLIKYTTAGYEKILKRELISEITILQEKHKNKEEKTKEEARHSDEIAKIKKSESISRMEREKQEEELKQKEVSRKLENKKFMLNHYKLFYEKPISPYLINFQNAEVGNKSHEFILKPTIAPLSFIQASYNFYTEYLGFSLGLYWKNQKVEEQDFLIKLRILKENFGIYPIALAVGVVQYSYNISNFSNSSDIEWGVSPSVMMNISFPQIYSTASLSVDRRKISFGLQYYPFFDNLDGKLCLVLQSDFFLMEEFEDRFGNNFILQPGLSFEVIENSVLLMISYENNEFVTLTFNFKF